MGIMDSRLGRWLTHTRTGRVVLGTVIGGAVVATVGQGMHTTDLQHAFEANVNNQVASLTDVWVCQHDVNRVPVGPVVATLTCPTPQGDVLVQLDHNEVQAADAYAQSLVAQNPTDFSLLYLRSMVGQPVTIPTTQGAFDHLSPQEQQGFDGTLNAQLPQSADPAAGGA
jgi:hypothetical protein